MPLKKYRKVEYLDDGVTSYQCLSCYKYWSAATNPEDEHWKFCPYCGVEWEGKHICKTIFEKKYAHEEKMTEEQKNRMYENTRRDIWTRWDIERRMKDGDDTILEWEYFHLYDIDYQNIRKNTNESLRKRMYIACQLRAVRKLNKEATVDTFGCLSEYRLVKKFEKEVLKVLT